VRRLLVTVLLAATFGACAARVPESPAPVRQAPSPIDFEEALAAGCYRCLEAALAQVGADTSQRFQLLLLLTLRAKELGLPFESWLDEAATAQPLGPEWQLYLDIARSVRVDPLSGDREVIMASTLQQRRQTTAVLEWRSALATGARPQRARFAAA
jgi:hypothetical protein